MNNLTYHFSQILIIWDGRQEILFNYNHLVAVSIIMLFLGFLICNNFAVALNSTDTIIQRYIEKYQELGEKGFIKDCASSMGNSEVFKSICQTVADVVKKKMENQTQISNSTSNAITQETYTDSRGFTVGYPSDWHVDGGSIVKGTREFSVQTFNDSRFSILDTPNFADIMRNTYKDDNGIKMTGNLGQINIDEVPANTFSFAEGNKETMVAALMHNGIPYLFKFETLKENFDKDTDNMLEFFGSIKFLDE
jgi:hypothetical protein